MDRRAEASRDPAPQGSGRVGRNPAPAWPIDASLVLLSGGSSRRLGQDKATTHVGGRPLVARLLAQVPAHVPIVLVGRRVQDLPDRVTQVREDPPGSGPLAGIGAGLPLVGTGLVGVLAVDMPFAASLVAGALDLLAEAGPGVEAVLPVDPEGYRQPLAAAYRTKALAAALSGLAPLADRPVRHLTAALRVMEWTVPAHDLADVDTGNDLRAARARVAEEGTDMEQWVQAVRDALGIDVAVELDAILDVARDAAHAVERPAAPVATFLIGAAVARGADPTEAAATISRLASGWAGAGRDDQ